MILNLLPFRILLYAAFVGLLFASTLGSAADAQQLRNYQAVQKVEQLFPNQKSLRNPRTERVRGFSTRRDEGLAHKLELDTVESVLARSRYESEWFNSYRGIAYLSYVKDVVNISEIMELQHSHEAEKLVLQQSLRLSNDYFFKPFLGYYYDRLVRDLKRVRDYTTVGVVKDPTGEIDLESGVAEDKRIVEFKIHASARYGIEPRLTFDEVLALRYQPFGNQLLLEYRYRF